MGELCLDLFVRNLRQRAAGALVARGCFCGLGSLGAFRVEAEAGKHGFHLFQLLGVLLVNCGDLLGDLLLKDDLGFENLLGGLLFQCGELFKDIEGWFGFGDDGVMGIGNVEGNHFSEKADP